MDRHKVIEVTRNYIEAFFTEGKTHPSVHIDVGIPVGSQLIRIEKPEYNKPIQFVFDSSTFPNNVLYNPLPVITCQITTITPPPPPIAQSVYEYAAFLDKGERQQMYEYLHYKHNCRIYK